jgi:hypothetical protein
LIKKCSNKKRGIAGDISTLARVQIQPGFNFGPGVKQEQVNSFFAFCRRFAGVLAGASKPENGTHMNMGNGTPKRIKTW